MSHDIRGTYKLTPWVHILNSRLFSRRLLACNTHYKYHHIPQVVIILNHPKIKFPVLSHPHALRVRPRFTEPVKPYLNASCLSELSAFKFSN